MNRPLMKEPRVSLADFEEMLADKPEDEKWELIDRRIYKSMVGARIEHHLIIANIDLAVSNHLLAKRLPGRTFRETLYLRKDDDELRSLPDLMIRCGQIEFGVTSIDDPVALIEVVSPGSETKDRLTKRLAYQRLPSLKHYILVSRDVMLVDRYAAAAGGTPNSSTSPAIASVSRPSNSR